MNRAYKVLPVFAGDVSGACSALYELGGMIVIHDPSGCNSTYNTHDEVRWNKMESLIFISGLTDMDAITGNDDKLIEDIVKAADELKPKFIAITNSPIPYVNGTDFDYIAREVSKRTGIKTFPVATNAFHDYTKGAASAYVAVVNNLLKSKEELGEIESVNIKVNLLGVTPLDYPRENDVNILLDFCKNNDFEVVANWSYLTSLEEVEKSLLADVNVVVSSTGIAAAKRMEELYGIPYVVGMPVGEFAKVFADDIRECFNSKKSKVSFLNAAVDGLECDSKRYVVGEPVIAGSVAADKRIKEGKNVRAVITTEIYDGLKRDEDITCVGEEEIEAVIRDADYVYGDPFYKYLCNDSVEFEKEPHFALSGRVYM
ncbi:nitrogenase component 1 [uncultured Eubacterium sp.]|uniref:nitrogenase component 1 n=1 Tax=uncultured Eubacterium sp. TaxID=165185 RepID=UPI000EC9D98A|nr:nitrogenase component 1 [uncultured Eubacterium sp.]HAH18604.1 oxidoreductase [Eubacterium sp.]